MLRVLVGLSLLLTAADHWTTYLCLRGDHEGWSVTEANPVADWLFANAGLVPGLLIDTAITVLAVTFLARSRALPLELRSGLLALIAALTSYAVLNNLLAVRALGMTLLG